MKGFKSNPVGHWSKGNMRNYMEAFAKSKDLDPLQADTWYNSMKLFCKTKVLLCSFVVSVCFVLFCLLFCYVCYFVMFSKVNFGTV